MYVWYVVRRLNKTKTINFLIFLDNSIVINFAVRIKCKLFSLPRVNTNFLNNLATLNTKILFIAAMFYLNTTQIYQILCKHFMTAPNIPRIFIIFSSVVQIFVVTRVIYLFDLKLNNVIAWWYSNSTVHSVNISIQLSF